MQSKMPFLEGSSVWLSVRWESICSMHASCRMLSSSLRASGETDKVNHGSLHHINSIETQQWCRPHIERDGDQSRTPRHFTRAHGWCSLHQCIGESKCGVQMPVLTPVHLPSVPRLGACGLLGPGLRSFAQGE